MPTYSQTITLTVPSLPEVTRKIPNSPIIFNSKTNNEPVIFYSRTNDNPVKFYIEKLFNFSTLNIPDISTAPLVTTVTGKYYFKVLNIPSLPTISDSES